MPQLNAPMRSTLCSWLLAIVFAIPLASASTDSLVGFAGQILDDIETLETATKEADLYKKKSRSLEHRLKHAKREMEKGLKELEKAKPDKANKKFKKARKEIAEYLGDLAKQVEKGKKHDKGKKGKKNKKHKKDRIDEVTAAPLLELAASIQVRLDQLIRGDIGNGVPIANAGADQSTSPGQVVTLDGSASSDPDGDQISFLWTIVSEPATSNIALDDVTGVTPELTPLVAGAYVFQLVVADAQSSSAADSVTVNVSVPNTPPVSDAGLDQSGAVGDLVTLDGTASKDIDGDLISYRWAFTTAPVGSLVTLANASHPMPTFTPDLAGLYEIELIVDDGQFDSDPDRVEINVQAQNTRPIANAGLDQRVFTNDQVTLDGSGSSDAEGDSLNYSWSLTTRPPGSLAQLDNPQAVKPEFSPDLGGQYVAQLVVNDADGASDPDTVVINATIPNTKPVADAGPDQSGFVGSSITLDGSASSDADGDDLGYNWSLVSVPATSTSQLDNASISGPSLTLDLPGTYVAQLIVNDGRANSTPDEVVVSTLNSRPLANAGPDQSISLGDNFQLDGSASSDADSDLLTYHWSILSQPLDSAATLSSADVVAPEFLADEEGDYVFQLVVNDGILSSLPDTQSLLVEPLEALSISLDQPADLLLTNQPELHFIGDLNRAATFTINGQPVILETDLSFDYNVALTEGDNQFELLAVDSNAEQTSLSRTITLDTTSPSAPDAGFVSVGPPGLNSRVLIEGQAGSVEPLSRIIVENLRTGETTILTADANGAFSIEVAGQAGDRYRLITEDEAGNQSEAVNVDDGSLPDDPADIAPELNPTGSISLADATAFLYTGPNPVQTGVSPGTIEPARAAVIRGQVTNRQGNPLAGVTVTVKGNEQYGQTVTRADGMFDLVVNGGGQLVIDYLRDGYLPVQRSLNSRIQDYQWAEDVVMIPLDPVVTTVDLSSPDPIQVARGSTQSDSDGSRTAVLMFEQGTTATMTLPDGSIQPLTSLGVRATEYTVGANGRETMPGPLPPSSGYNYAVELSVDEAVAAGAKTVTFSKPVKFYVENFTDYNIGARIPVGYYDFDKAAWLGSDDGRIIEITGIAGDLAEIDIDGDGIADDEATLATLNIDAVERRQLATDYAPGQSLWRVEVSHFSPYDCNWPYRPPTDATPPQGRPQPATQEDNPENPDEECGCIIGATNQTLGELEPVAGTNLDLYYQSRYAKGYLANRTVRIPVTPAAVPDSLQSVQVDVFVAGTRARLEFDNSPGQTYDFVWDGLDAYGREVQGLAVAQIQIKYRYPLVRLEVNSETTQRQSWAALGDSGVELGNGRTSVDFDSVASYAFFIGPAQSGIPSAGLGGWTLSNHHGFDVTSGTVSLGNGDEIKINSVSPVLKHLGGGGPTPFGFADREDQVPKDLNFSGYTPPTATPDGSLYMGSRGYILKINRDNTLEKVAGARDVTTYGKNISGDELGDGGDALAASFRIGIEDGIGMDASGNIYFSSRSNGRIRKIDINNIITTIAGDQSVLYSDPGDGGLAVDASLNTPRKLVVGSDGSVYFVDSLGRPPTNEVIRVIRPDGTIHRYAGGGRNQSTDDATQAPIGSVISMVIDSQDNLYITDERKIRKITPTGIIKTVAGGGNISPFNGIVATQASLGFGTQLAVDSLDRLYLATTFQNSGVYRVDDGQLILVGGVVNDPSVDYDPPPDDGGLAFGSLGVVRGMTILSDDSIVLNTEIFKNRSRRQWLYEFDQGYPTGYQDGIFNIASRDGVSVFQFDQDGRHLKTINAITGISIDEFDYDADGLLSDITDSFGNVIQINRDANGMPQSIRSADGQVTGLTTGADGLLTNVSNPLGEAIKMQYDAGGLLTLFTDKRDNATTFTYDAQGLLIRDVDSEGGSWNLDKTILDEQNVEVAMTSAEGRSRKYIVGKPSEDTQSFTLVEADGSTYTNQRGRDGLLTETFADGTHSTRQYGPDPVFGMQSPVDRTRTMSTPLGLTLEVTSERDIVLADVNDPFSIQSISETQTKNGRDWVRAFDANNLTWTQTTPESRVTTVQLNPQGLPVEIEVSGFNSSRYSYDTRGRLQTTSESAGADDPDARITSLSYVETGGTAGYLESIVNAEQQLTRFEYDALGRVEKQIFPDGRELSYRYDANGNLAGLTPAGRPEHVFSYNNVDRPVLYTPPGVAGITSPQTIYDFNRDKQLTLVTRPDGQKIALGYGATTGLLDSLSIPQGNYTYAYDPDSAQLTGITAPGGSTLGYTYDGFLLKNMTLGGEVAGSVDRNYDNDFRVSSRSVNGGSTINFNYDGDDLLTVAGSLTITRNAQKAGMIDGTTLGSLSTSRAYNGFAEMENFEASYGGTSLFSTGYTRDRLGRIESKTETILGTTTVTTYDYDPGGRLVREKTGDDVTRYTYDSNSNRTHVNGVEIASYDDQDRLESYASASYAYTDNGELLSKTENGLQTDYQYDVLGDLRQVALPAGSNLPDGTILGAPMIIDYVIDGEGRRVGKKIGGVLTQGFLYKDRLNPIVELDGSNEVVSRFVYGTRINVPDYMVKGGVTYRIISDQLGSPRLVVNTADGSIAQRMDYDAWGKVITDTNPGFQPFGFAGGLLDQHTGLTRFGARDYDAQTGRWTARDPIMFDGGDTNLYGYAFNDPVNLTDFFGLSTERSGNIQDEVQASQAEAAQMREDAQQGQAAAAESGNAQGDDDCAGGSGGPGAGGPAGPGAGGSPGPTAADVFQEIDSTVRQMVRAADPFHSGGGVPGRGSSTSTIGVRG